MTYILRRLVAFLRWSERYTKTDMVYLMKGGFWLTAGQGVASLSAFVLAVALANLLPQEVYGSYKYLLAVGGLLAMPALLGMNAAVISAVSRGSAGTYVPALKSKLAWGLFGSAAGLALAAYHLLEGNTTFALAFVFIALLAPLMESLSLYDAVLQGLTRFKESSLKQSVAQIAVAILTIAILFVTDDLILLVLGYFAGWTLIRAYFTARVGRVVSAEGAQDAEAITYGKHLSAIGVIGTLAAYADRLLIFHFLGPIELAIYTVATGPAEHLKSVFKTVAALALPKFSMRAPHELFAGVFGKTWRLALAALLAAAVFALLVPFLYSILFPLYPEAIPLAQLFVLSVAGVALVIPQTALQAVSAKRELYVLSIVSSTFQIAALVVGVLTMGLFGAILARVTVRAVTLLCGLILVTRYTRHR